jgi:hypothetical protein
MPKNREQKDGLASSTPKFSTKVRRGMMRQSRISDGEPKRIKATLLHSQSYLAEHHVLMPRIDHGGGGCWN